MSQGVSEWVFEGGVPDFAWLKACVLDEGPAAPAIGCLADVEAHLAMLRRELSGQSVLLYYHNWLIVHLRRGTDGYDQFQALWQAEHAYLVHHLSLRWLVSACDTIADLSPDAAQRATALCGALLANTVKLYETERHFTPALQGAPEHAALRGPFHPRPLFDGMTTFAIGSGDLIDNMQRRVDKISAASDISGKILTEITTRLKTADTIYRRLDHYTAPR